MNLSMPEPVHQTTYRVLYGDTDAAGVVYYANYLRYFEKGRTEYMRDLVMTYKKIEDLGLLLPVIECYSRYKAPASYDDLLTIETSLAELKNVSCRFNYRIYKNDSDNSRTLLAKGYTVNASVNRDGKLTRLPAHILEKLQKNLILSL
ncbi:MAG: thioesterase family protein [Desulfobacterales bacterium]|jgi:acyl-CoA thioester hydrolase|nr:thioesterase family protein [Desulfobacterales bacterium]